MDIAKLIDEAKKHSGLPSDRALAAQLHVSHAVPCQWRTGFSTPKPEHAQKLAELAGLDPAPIVAAVLIDAAKDAGLRKTLERFKRAVAAALFAVALLPLSPAALAHQTHQGNLTTYTLYALRRWFRPRLDLASA